MKRNRIYRPQIGTNSPWMKILLVISLSLWSGCATSPAPIPPPTIEPCYIPIPHIVTNQDLVEYLIQVVGELKKCATKVEALQP